MVDIDGFLFPLCPFSHCYLPNVNLLFLTCLVLFFFPLFLSLRRSILLILNPIDHLCSLSIFQLCFNSLPLVCYLVHLCFSLYYTVSLWLFFGRVPICSLSSSVTSPNKLSWLQERGQECLVMLSQTVKPPTAVLHFEHYFEFCCWMGCDCGFLSVQSPILPTIVCSCD